MTTSNRLKRLDALTGRLQDQLRDPSVARHERRETLRKRLNLVTALLTKELKTKTSLNVPTAAQPSTQEATTPVPIQQKAPQMPVTPEAPPCHPKSKKVTASQHTAAPSTTQVWQPPQVYLGNITGAAGDAFAFGAALGFDDTLFYLDLVGSKTAVESVWAQLDLGRDLKIISLEHKTEYPLLGEKAGFKRFQRSLITGAEHLLILHKDIAETTYPDTHQTVVFYPDHAQAVARMSFHITQLVTVPVFPEWHDYLWRLGEAQRLITPCKCLGVNKPYCYRLLLSRKRWTDLLCAGLKNKAIHLPA